MRRKLVLLTAAAAVSMLLGTSPALAHEEREVGKYRFVVGFGTEPAYSGIPNSVQLLLSDASSQPVSELRDGLNVEVAFGDQSASFPIEPFFEVGEFGEPGDYRAWFIPTRPGQYSFHFTGKVNGQAVDETFTSSETTFSDVVDPTDVEFPVQDPTVGQLSERVDREVPRLNNAIDEVKTRASDVSDDASSAKTFAIVALVIGVLGLAIGVVSLVRGRRVS